MKAPKVGVLALARSTFDMEFAEEIVLKAWNNLQASKLELVGSPKLLMDDATVQNALQTLEKEPCDLLLILQVTFTDASMIAGIAQSIQAPLVLWSFPEPRNGGRLRLNSLCGINLAGHSLGKNEQAFHYVHQAAEQAEATEKISSLAKASQVVRRLRETKLAVIGKHPDGFDTCSYDPKTANEFLGVQVDSIPLPDFIEQAKDIPDQETDQVYQRVDQEVTNLAEMEEASLRKSLKVYSALSHLAEKQKYQGLAVRCWPEFFTDFGCAACGAMSMMNEDQIPCGCEADLYGTLTTLILQWIGEKPAFLTDLVDIDPQDNTGVFWHCGLAPKSMADPQSEIRATLHTNRKKPLLYEFPLKPGRVTIARLSQAKNRTQLVLAGGEMLRRPMSYTGTSGVIRFDLPAQQILDTIMAERLEHHFSISYGEFRPVLRNFAKMLDLQVLEMT
ncbi:MAG: L-fucose/L-arabinose isomerase family protein [SAR324 cluster bacterium]|nr:L-fucose/L-arabinose isomerase family protein [SAR324 cluster bacterium]